MVSVIEPIANTNGRQYTLMVLDASSYTLMALDGPSCGAWPRLLWSTESRMRELKIRSLFVRILHSLRTSSHAEVCARPGRQKAARKEPEE